MRKLLFLLGVVGLGLTSCEKPSGVFDLEERTLDKALIDPAVAKERQDEINGFGADQVYKGLSEDVADAQAFIAKGDKVVNREGETGIEAGIRILNTVISSTQNAYNQTKQQRFLDLQASAESILADL